MWISIPRFLLFNHVVELETEHGKEDAIEFHRKTLVGKQTQPCARAPRGFYMGEERISTMGARESQGEQRLRRLIEKTVVCCYSR